MLQRKLADRLLEKKQTLSTVESCTGGGIAAFCTDLAGSSDWFLGGIITYANSMKMKLGVSESVIQKNGAVSEPVVLEMAQKGLQYCQSNWCISVSGIAGPGGGSQEKPIGTVWFAWLNNEQSWTDCQVFSGDRDEVRSKTIEYAITKLIELLN